MEEEKIPVRVFLSYRSHWKEQCEQLRAAVSDYNADPQKPCEISLLVSESELEERDSITAFMDRLAKGRFVILMLGLEYFQSPYTLHELLEIHRRQDAPERLLALAVKADASLNQVTLERAIGQWQQDEWTRQRLRELQEEAPGIEFHGLSRDGQCREIAGRLERAYQELVKPLVDNVTEVCSTPGQLLGLLEERATQAFERERKELRERQVGEIGRQLARLRKEDRLGLARLLDLGSDNPAACASALVETTCDQAMDLVGQWVEQRHRDLDGAPLSRWEAFFAPVEQICGWLLLGSVSAAWWLHNGIAMRAGPREQGAARMGLHEPAYAEVVISRTLLEPAEYTLNSYHDLIPARFQQTWAGCPGEDPAGEPLPLEFQGGFVIDATGQARAEELLLPLYWDLMGRPSKLPHGFDERFRRVLAAVKGLPGNTIRYYVVRASYLEQLEQVRTSDGRRVLEEIARAARGRFACIAVDSRPPDGLPVCKEDEETLLARMAHILRIQRGRATEHDP